jgi:hypothetical protein
MTRTTEAVKLEEGGGDEAASGLNEADLAEDPIMQINFTVRIDSEIFATLQRKSSANAPSLGPHSGVPPLVRDARGQ